MRTFSINVPSQGCRPVLPGTSARNNAKQLFLAALTNCIVTMRGVKNLGHGFERMHLEGMRGNIKQNERYCSKFAQLVFFGEPFAEPGARRDANAVYAMVKAGKTDLEIMEADFAGYARFMKAISRLRTLIRPKREGYPTVLLLVGRPGCGKTKNCYDEYHDLWEPPINMSKNVSNWFVGYVGQKEVLLDEFEGHLPLNSLLKLLDRYVRQVPIKGGFTWFNPDVIMLTANAHPSSWYDFSDRKDKEAALRRRITRVMSWNKAKKDWDFFDNTLGPGEIATKQMKKFWPMENYDVENAYEVIMGKKYHNNEENSMDESQ